MKRYIILSIDYYGVTTIMFLEYFGMILLAFVFVFLNGFFVLSEFAIVKVRRSRLEELAAQKIPNSALALKITHKLDSYLSATQLGITLSSLALGWIGEPAVAKLLEALIGDYFISNTVLLHSISFAIAFSSITFLHVILGELIPKSIAIARAEKVALFVAKPLLLFWILFYPLIRFFDIVAGFFLKLMGIRHASETESVHSEEEIKLIVGESLKGGVIDDIESEIIQNAVNFSDTIAREIMTPRKDMICLNSTDTLEENMQIIINSKHTRFPLSNGDKDKITGMVHIRDILEHNLKGEKIDNLNDIQREMIVVIEGRSIDKILAEMNKRQIHTALVIDEYGGTAGLLTMEDIIEEIMGDINDEHDSKKAWYKKIDDTTYHFDGMISIDDLCDILGINIENDQVDHVTLAGYALDLFGYLPKVNEEISDDQLSYKILAINGTRIVKLQVKILDLEIGDID